MVTRFRHETWILKAKNNCFCSVLDMNIDSTWMSNAKIIKHALSICLISRRIINLGSKINFK